MNVMTASPMTPSTMQQNEEQRLNKEQVDIPQQQEAAPDSESPGEGSPKTTAETELGDAVAEEKETVAEKDDRDEKDEKEERDEKKTAAKPKRKSAPRKAAGTKTLVVLKEGRVHYADVESVLVVDLDEASSPDTDVHDVLDRLTELRDAADSPGKADAVRALTDLIQEKALG
jgi:hypothetical protein